MPTGGTLDRVRARPGDPPARSERGWCPPAAGETRRIGRRPDPTFPRVCIRPERKRPDRAVRSHQPSRDRPAVGRERRTQHAIVSRDPSPVDRALGRRSARPTRCVPARSGHPCPAAILGPSRRFRSSVLTSSLTSAMSVLSSITRTVPVAAWNAEMSTTPRSPPNANETSGAITQPGRLPNRPRDEFVEPRVSGVEQPVQLARAPPRDQVDPDIEEPPRPSQTVDARACRHVPARSARSSPARRPPSRATSACRSRRRIRTARTAAPSR